MGVLAVDRLLRRRGRPRRDPGHRPRHRHRRHRVPVGRLAAALRGAGPRRRASRATTTSRAIPMRARFPASCCSAGTRRCSSPMPSSSRSACSTRWRRRRRRCAGSSSRRSRSPAWTSPPPTCSPSWTTALHAAGIELCFAEMKDPVKDKLKRFGLFGPWGGASFRRSARRSAAISRRIGRLGGLGGRGPMTSMGRILEQLGRGYHGAFFT